ncbi:enoyl-CoA hydratase-related protein [Modestobacter versicolor]|uniref:enoyl-CoA hydratase-related protein n=1 Tax=Modestobacter versicolor TaxID=429133 RepID=UPI0034DDF083
MSPDAPLATCDVSDGVALITFRRAHARNAVNAQLSAAVGEALEAADADPAVRAVVVTGDGPVFCAGADLKGIAAGEDLTAPGHPEWGFAGLVQHAVSLPVIAAVNGHAMGGGAEIVLACDLAVMAGDALFGLPEVTRGLYAAAGGTIRLPRQVPLKVALQAGLTGDPMTAGDAARWGLINAVVPRSDVVDEALTLARRIAANAPLAVAVTKSMMHAAAGAGPEWGGALWRRQDQEMARLLRSRDAREGAQAFVEKRPPAWTGR